MKLTKPIKIKRDETNKVKTSSGEFLEYISWKECKELAFGIAIHEKRFPSQGYLLSKKVDEVIFLLSGSGRVVVKEENSDRKFSLELHSVMFIPKGTSFYFEPNPKMEIISATSPAWYPKQQKGLDYRRSESGRLIL